MKRAFAVIVQVAVAVLAGYAGGRYQDPAHAGGPVALDAPGVAAAGFAQVGYARTAGASASAGYRAAVARAGASVVTVQSARRDGLGAPITLRLGSGVVLDHHGLVVTSISLALDANEFAVALPDGTSVPAQLLGTDASTGLALLRAQGGGLLPIEVADASSAAVGDIVLAIGDPFGLGQSATQGIISAMPHDTAAPGGDLIQSDAAIHAGSLGGALVDSVGRLVGINTAILSIENEPGTAVAIPAGIVQALVAKLNLPAGAAPTRQPRPAGTARRELLAQAGR